MLENRIDTPDIVARIPEKTAPLSFAQERLWFLEQMGLTGPAYNMPFALRLEGVLSHTALQRTFDELVRRHESLRTRFEVVAGVPVQVIDTFRPIEVELRNLSSVPSDQQAERVQYLCRDEARSTFDLQRDSLIRVSVIQLSERCNVLLMTMHHIISDGWSLQIINRELSACYNAFARGTEVSLPHLSIQYADFAIWQRGWLKGDELRAHREYWKDQLRGIQAELTLPTDRPRPAVPSFKGATLDLRVSPVLRKALHVIALQEGTTLFTVLLAAFQVLLFRYGGDEDVVVGSPVAARTHTLAESIVGFFVNMLPIRGRLAGNPSFRHFLERVKEASLGAFSHQDLPFEKLVEEIRPERGLGRQPIFQVTLALHNFPEEPLHLAGLTWSPMEVDQGAALFDLSVHLYEAHEGLHGVLEYATDLFDSSTVRRIGENYLVLLESIVCDPDSRVGQLQIISDNEREAVVRKFNETRHPHSDVFTVHELFERQAEMVPNAVSASHSNQSLTYCQLNRKANQVARYLRCKGVGAGDLVGICLLRGLKMVVAVVGILKAGAAYVPLDPKYPRSRLRYMIDQSAPKVLLTQANVADCLAGSSVNVTLLDQEWDLINAQPEENLWDDTPQAAGADLAYVIYTSGSTGRPKGVAMPHFGLVNLIRWHRGTFDRPRVPRVLQFAALSFDVAFQEIFTTLCAGGEVVLLDEELRMDVRQLLLYLEEKRVHRLFLPPLMLQSLSETSVDSAVRLEELRDIITAGEQLRISPEIRRWFKRHPHCRLHNHYGPSETHVVTTLSLPKDPDAWPIHPAIGAPISNTEIFVLDGEGQPVGIGVSGELHIGGCALARGYLGHPELTSQRFISNLLSEDFGSRLYKTGDLARWRLDGTLEYLGRNDDQVKIRGYRIELGEIEAQLARNPRVREAAVIASDDRLRGKRLIAYVTLREISGLHISANGSNEADRCRSTQSPSWIEELRSHLKSALPSYMIPAEFVHLPSLPTTPNGKLDRSALPAPDFSGAPDDSFEEPLDATEQRIAEVWKELLGVRRVSRRDNFFDIGGHSLLATRVVANIRKSLQSNITVADFMSEPTIASLADRLRANNMRKGSSARMALRIGGSRHAVCFLPTVVGIGTHFKIVIQQLSGLFDYYTCSLPGLLPDEKPISTIEELSGHCLDQFVTDSSYDEWSFVGWSFGGVLARETATQALVRGFKVRKLVLIDTYLPPANVTLAAVADDQALLETFSRTLNGVETDFKSDRDSLFTLFRSNIAAMFLYEPTLYRGEIVEVQAEDSLRTWTGEDGHPRRLCLEQSLKIVLPGDHYSIMEPDGTELLAAALSRALGPGG